jgi:hypothetical protein
MSAAVPNATPIPITHVPYWSAYLPATFHRLSGLSFIDKLLARFALPLVPDLLERPHHDDTLAFRLEDGSVLEVADQDPQIAQHRGARAGATAASMSPSRRGCSCVQDELHVGMPSVHDLSERLAHEHRRPTEEERENRNHDSEDEYASTNHTVEYSQ